MNTQNKNLETVQTTVDSPNLFKINKAAKLEVKEESIQLLHWVLKTLEAGPTLHVCRQRIHARLEMLKNNEKITRPHGQG